MFGKMAGYSDRVERVAVAPGETRAVTMTLAKVAVAAPVAKGHGDITSFFEARRGGRKTANCGSTRAVASFRTSWDPEASTRSRWNW